MIALQTLGIEQLQEILDWRQEVLIEVFGQSPDSGLMQANEQYFLSHLTKGTCLFAVALKDGQKAGCGALCLYQELPSPDNPGGWCGYLMNIYTRPAFRKQGVAKEVVIWLITQAQNRKAGKIYLESTAAAKELYRLLGFEDMKDYMKWKDGSV